MYQQTTHTHTFSLAVCLFLNCVYFLLNKTKPLQRISFICLAHLVGICNNYKSMKLLKDLRRWRMVFELEYGVYYLATWEKIIFCKFFQQLQLIRSIRNHKFQMEF